MEDINKKGLCQESPYWASIQVARGKSTPLLPVHMLGFPRQDQITPWTPRLLTSGWSASGPSSRTLASPSGRRSNPSVRVPDSLCFGGS